MYRNWEDLKIQEAVASSCNYSEALRKIGVTPNSGNIKHLKLWISKLEIDVSHFSPFGFGNGGNVSHEVSLSEILVENSQYKANLKKRLMKEGLFENKCSNCGLIEWLGKPISLQIDHINGKRSDNNIENLRVLCPNCHSQTETFGARNKTIKRKEWICEGCGGKASKGKSRCWNCWSLQRKK